MIAILLLAIIVNPIEVQGNFTESTETIFDTLNLIATLKEAITLDCPNLVNDNNLSLVLWKHKDLTIPSSLSETQVHENQRIHAVPNGSLKINKIQYSDAGNYTCEGISTKKLYVVQITLTVRGPPLNVLNFTYNAAYPNELTFFWDITNTDSNIARHFNLTLCKSLITKACDQVTLEYPQYQYTFKKLDAYASYRAEIVAFNTVGRSQRTDLRATTQPGVPSARVFIVKSKPERRLVRLTLQCLPCSDPVQMRGKFKFYVVRYRSHNGENISVQFRSVNFSRDEIVIKQLHPYHNYSLSVAASNGVFVGPVDVIKVATKQDVPNPSTYLYTGLETSTTIEVKWIQASDDYGPITGYNLKIQETAKSSNCLAQDGDQNPVQLGRGAIQHIFEGLRTRTPYTVCLASCNREGLSKFVSTMSCTDRPEPNPPRLISVEPAPGAVLVHWYSRYFSNVSSSEFRFEICWQRQAPPPSSPSSSSPLRNRYDHRCIAIRLRRDSLQTNNSASVFKEKIALDKFQLNETSIYLFYVRVSVTSDRCKSLASNCRRLEATSEKFSFEMTDWRGPGYRKSRMNEVILGVGIVTVALIVIFVCIFFVCRNRLKGACVPSHRYYMRPPAAGEYIEVSSRQSIPKIVPLEKTPYLPIPVTGLLEHILKYRADDGAGFLGEFEAIESMENGKWSISVAKHRDNLTKNRYTNIFPYDHSRVPLLSTVGERSYYINANFVDGYERTNAYIATQGPLKETVADFWQMVWDHGCEIIVMISNFVERGRCKCEQYWSSMPAGPGGVSSGAGGLTGQALMSSSIGPGQGQRRESVYGNIGVRLVYENVMAFYTERHFRIRNIRNKKSANKDRMVYHYQYTDWRDFDVPPSPLPVLVFVRATIRRWSDQSGPIVVHCSAGVGRTGTYICIESQIRQMETEHQVNIRGFLEHIRQQRMKLVQTESQYTFIHDALYEYFICPDHEVYKADLAVYIDRLREMEPCGLTKLEIQFKKCVQFEPNDYELMESHNKFNIHKNRSDIVPINSRRINISCEPGVEGSNYINASIIQGYWKMKEYIVTQHPLNQTEHDFWKMVWDDNCSMIVLLSDCSEIPDTLAAACEDPDSAFVAGDEDAAPIAADPATLPLHRFWPANEADTRDFRGGMRVSFRSCEPGPGGDESAGLCYEFLLSSSAEDYAQSVRMYLLRRWPQSVAESVSLLRLLLAVQGGPSLDHHNLHHREQQQSGTPADERLRLLLDLEAGGNGGYCGTAVHPSAAAGVAEAASKYQRGPIVVVDELGGPHAAIFVAICTLLHQLRQEDSLDVYFVAKMLHFERPHIFQNSKDLEFVYELLAHVIEQYSGHLCLLPRAGPPLSNGSVMPHSEHHNHTSNSVYHYATLGGGGSAGSGPRFNTSNGGHHLHHHQHMPGNYNSTLNSSTYHRSSPRLSSLSSSLSRRRASSADSSQLPNVLMSQTTISAGPPAASRMSWNSGESRPGFLPVPPPHHQIPASAPAVQIIANPLTGFSDDGDDRIEGRDSDSLDPDTTTESII